LPFSQYTKTTTTDIAAVTTITVYSSMRKLDTKILLKFNKREACRPKGCSCCS